MCFGYEQIVPSEDELRDAGEPALLEHVRAHDEVRVPEAARGSAVGADPAGERGQVEDDLGLGVAEEARGVVLVREVVVRAARDDDVVARGFEPLDEVRAEEPAATGDERLHSTVGGGGRDPVDTARPFVAVVRVPRDRPAHALFPGDERPPAGLPRELLEARP